MKGGNTAFLFVLSQHGNTQLSYERKPEASRKIDLISQSRDANLIGKYKY